MHPAKILGRVVATHKEDSLTGVKLIILQPTDWEGNPIDDYLVAADAVSAGYDEFVFFVESMEAAVAFSNVPPIDASIVGIIDGVQLDDEYYTRSVK
ncbi:MAG: EutN/CcmL family microcompartment protein [Candidatus Eremiobacteraeota bacterium]|nr:EutN/CcmL family microcompartment protein [Candidatus Eremiobacteraeota bacterium]